MELLGAEHVLVADRDRHALARRIERRLIGRTGHCVAGRQGHVAHPVADEAGHRKVFAERHEMAFHVYLHRVGQRYHDVLERLALLARAGRQPQRAEDHGAAALSEGSPQIGQILGHVLDQCRNRSLWPHDEARACVLLRQAVVQRERVRQLLRLPLHVLRDSALH